MKKTIYTLYDNGVEVCKGDRNEVALKCGIRADNVRWYACKKIKYKKRYSFEADHEIIYEEKKPVKKTNSRKAQKERLDYYIRHLEQYGNVASRIAPNDYIPLLAERGYKCRVLVYKEFSDTPTKRRGTKGYVIERID